MAVAGVAHAGRTAQVLSFLKIEHSLFALPFVLAGFVVGLLDAGLPLAPGPEQLRLAALALVAAVSARTAAMTLNRILDRKIDARNPRTAGRHLPRGTLGLRFAWGLSAVAFALLFAAAWALNPLCLALAPVLVGLFVLYPYTKRFTWMCHFVLGATFLSAGVGGYLAVTGSLAGMVAFEPVFWGGAFLAAAAGAWVAGFDVVYALLDVEVDRAQGIHSVPARFGVPAARLVAAGLHALAVGCLAVGGFLLGLAWPWWAALVAVAALLGYEHATVDPRDAEAINRAFFAVNAVVGWVVLAGLVGGVLL